MYLYEKGGRALCSVARSRKVGGPSDPREHAPVSDPRLDSRSASLCESKQNQKNQHRWPCYKKNDAICAPRSDTVNPDWILSISRTCGEPPSSADVALKRGGELQVSGNHTLEEDLNPSCMRDPGCCTSVQTPREQACTPLDNTSQHSQIHHNTVEYIRREIKKM